MSVRGSSRVPNNWKISGESDGEEQAAWYREMFETTKRRSWVKGYGIWSWAGAPPYKEEHAAAQKNYEIYAKPAERVVKAYFSS
jgi:hypothetical protein